MVARSAASLAAARRIATGAVMTALSRAGNVAAKVVSVALASIFVRREALTIRVEVRDLPPLALSQ